MAKTSKKPETVSKTLKTITITGKRPEKKVAKIDSISVGGTKRATKDISKAISTLNTSNTAKGYMKGLNSSNPVSSSKTLGARGAASDLVNKVIDGSKKKK